MRLQFTAHWCSSVTLHKINIDGRLPMACRILEEKMHRMGAEILYFLGNVSNVRDSIVDTLAVVCHLADYYTENKLGLAFIKYKNH